MPAFPLESRVHLTRDLAFVDKTFPSGTCGTVKEAHDVGAVVWYRVQFDKDSGPLRLVREDFLAASCPSDAPQTGSPAAGGSVP